MSKTLEAQKSELERALETTTDHTVRNLIQDQIGSLQRKIDGKGKRTARTKDGAVVQIGSTVFQFQAPYVYRDKYSATVPVKERPGTIEAKTITAISNKGEIAFDRIVPGSYYNRRHTYVAPNAYFSTGGLAHAGMIEKCNSDIKDAKKKIVEAQQHLEDRERALVLAEKAELT